AAPPGPPPPMLLHILFVIGGIVLGLASALAIHELGHFAFATVASIPVRQVSIGAGPLLLRKRLGTIHFDLRAVPISGFVQPAIYENVRKSHTILFVLGGVLANAALFGLLVILDRVLPLSTSAQFALIYPVAGAQVWVGFWSLVPARHAVDGA